MCSCYSRLVTKNHNTLLKWWYNTRTLDVHVNTQYNYVYYYYGDSEGEGDGRWCNLVIYLSWVLVIVRERKMVGDVTS